jgi:DNA-binding XRE family transcriptional regulator
LCSLWRAGAGAAQTQEDVALASGVSRRFIIELEAGRITCELGRSLVVASVVGIRPVDQLIASDDSTPLLPDLLENENDK